jgi:hypothetical protein
MFIFIIYIYLFYVTLLNEIPHQLEIYGLQRTSLMYVYWGIDYF